MTVKAKRGRRRYIYFVTRNGTPANQEDMLAGVVLPASRSGLKSLKVLQFDGSRGIVRCALTECTELKRLINEDRPGHVGFTTVCTSGTVRTLRDRYFPDEHRGRRPEVRT